MRPRYIVHKSKSSKHRSKVEKPIRIIALLFFIGLFSFYFYGAKTGLTWLNLSRIPVGFAVIFSFIPLRILPQIFRRYKELKVLLALFALAPVFSGLTLILNFHFSNHPYTESYIVESYKVYPADKTFEVNFANKAFKDHHQLRRFSYDEVPNIPVAIHYTMAKGLFGMKVIKEATPQFVKK